MKKKQLAKDLRALETYTHNEFGKLDHRLSDMDVKLDEILRLLRGLARTLGTGTNGDRS